MIGLFLNLILIVLQHPVLWPFDIIILTALDRPEEEHPSRESRCQRQKDQEEHAPRHDVNLARMELATTESELNAMAAAAMTGCMTPRIARGITTRL